MEDQFEKEEIAFPDMLKNQLREQVKADVDAFLKAGGDYTDCPNLDLSKYTKKRKR